VPSRQSLTASNLLITQKMPPAMQDGLLRLVVQCRSLADFNEETAMYLQSSAQNSSACATQMLRMLPMT
jgi:hypothetical protein